MGTERSDAFWELALAVNAAFKGLLGAQGQSGHICRRTHPVPGWLAVESGWPAVMEQVAQAVHGQLRSGDVVVIADKVVAAALGRVGPRSLLREPDPKTVPADGLPELARRYSEELGFPVAPIHLLLADEYGEAQATLGADDHNGRAAELARVLQEREGVVVDVIISDTDTGLDTRTPLIGMVTIAATPLGATRGVNLYEAMRCAVAAEFTRGHDRGIPVVVCEPAERRRERAGVGQPRPYAGVLQADREQAIAHA